MKNKITRRRIFQNYILTLLLSFTLQACLPKASSDNAISSTDDNNSTSCKIESNKLRSLAASEFEDNEDLFLDINEKEQTLVAFSRDTAKTKRLVQINTEELRKRLVNRKSNIFSLPLTKGRSVRILINEVRVITKNNIVVAGNIENELNSNVTLVVNKNVIVANITNQSNNETYQIRYLGNQIHSIDAIDRDVEAIESSDCLTVDGGAQQIQFLSKSQIKNLNTENFVSSNSTEVDVLVAYTPNAARDVGGVDAMKALIQMGVADSNKAYKESGVNLTIRLVGTLALIQNEYSFTADLSALKNKADGKWDEVHQERKRVGADLVALVAYYPASATAGIGYVGSVYSTGFSITKTTAFRQFSFTHELGHNMGLNHTDGYQNSSGRFRSVMAYGSYTRIPRFSNPGLDYNGFLTGTSSKNSAKILNENAIYVASLTEKVLPEETPIVSNPVTGPTDTCTE